MLRPSSRSPAAAASDDDLDHRDRGCDDRAADRHTLEGRAGKEADKLCTASTARILRRGRSPDFGEDGPQPDEVEASAPFWRATAAEGQTLVDQLSQLQPAKDEQKQWDGSVDLLETGTVDYANSLLGPAEDGDPDAFYEAADRRTAGADQARRGLAGARHEGLRRARRPAP